MKYKLITALACAASLTALQAQDASPSPSAAGKPACKSCGNHGKSGARHRGGERFQALIAQLNLTPEQKAQIKPLLEAAKTQAQSIKADTTLSREQKMAKMREVHQALRGQIEGVLTPEQKQKLQEFKAQHRGHRGGGNHGGGQNADAGTGAAQ